MTASTDIVLSLTFFILLLLLHFVIFNKSSSLSNISNNIFKLSAEIVVWGIIVIILIFQMNLILDDSILEANILNIFNSNAINITAINVNILSLNFTFMHSISAVLLVMFMIIIASIYYTVSFSRIELLKFIVYSLGVFSAGMLFVCTYSIFVMFVAFELILLPTTFVLEFFSKTARSREATCYMVIWTQLGAIILFFFAYIFFTTVNFNDTVVLINNATRTWTNILVLLTFFGFGAKIPVWPFYWWLPEAHVEVSTNFSIVLSGVSIKFALLGFIRFMEILNGGDVYWICAVLAFIGLLDAALKIDTESDIKKIVAYETVVEMHALVAYISLDVDAFMDIALFLLVAHCWISTTSFIIVDFISKRYHSRNVEHLYGIIAESPRLIKFIFLVVFIFSSLPGTLIYSVELYVQLLNTTSIINFVLFIVVQCFMVVWSKNIWWLLWGGDAIHHKYVQPFTMTKSEYMFILILLLQLTPSLNLVDLWMF